MTVPIAAIVLGVSAVAAWLATGLMLPALRRHAMDVPNARSLHTQPIPRGGGAGILVGLAAGLAVGMACGMPRASTALVAAVGLVALVGFLDDRLGGIPAGARLIAHFAAASFVVWRLGGIPVLPLPHPANISLGAAAASLTVLWIVAITNIYNFLDGIDGFAGTQGAVAGLALCAALAEARSQAVGLALAGGCVGFLYHNWRPARVFMGDVGSCAIGFALAAVPLQSPASSRGGVAFAVLLSLWFFLSDGCFTLAKRLVRGERVWQAHREHLYQRLARTGLRHDQVTLAVGGAAALLAAGAAFCTRYGMPAGRWVVLCLAGAAFAGYVVWVRRRESLHGHRPAPTEIAGRQPADFLDSRQAGMYTVYRPPGR